MKRAMDNAVGDMVLADNQLGIGTTDHLSTLTVRTRPSFQLTGTLTKTEDSATVTGTGTKFLTELTIGDRIEVGGNYDAIRGVVAIASDTSLTVDTPHKITETVTALAHPSTARFDAPDGTPQVVVNDGGNIGVGTMGPRGQLEINGPGAHEWAWCPVVLRIHTPLSSDAWSIVMSNDANDNAPGVALSTMALDDDGGNTLSFRVFDGVNDAFEPVRIDGHGLVVLGSLTVLAQGIGTGATPYAVQPSDHYLYPDAGTAGMTITLPPCGEHPGRVLSIFKKSGTGDVTIAPHTGEQINGVAGNKTISTLYGGLQLVSTGDMWVATVLTAA